MKNMNGQWPQYTVQFKVFLFFKYHKLLIQKYHDVLGTLPHVTFYNIFPKLILHWLHVIQNVVKKMSLIF